MTRLSLDVANKIMANSLAEARRRDLKPLCVAIVDASGYLVTAQREDGASMFRFDIALGKAWAAAAMGVSSSQLGEAARANPNFFVALAATAKGKFLAQAGAVPIFDDAGSLLGAVGASGALGADDEAICRVGVQSANLSVAAN